MPSINDLLQRSQAGRIILQVSKTKELNDSMRNKMCNIIVGYMEDNNITLTNKIAEDISKRIVKTFPSEAKGTYFIERKKIDTKNTSISGKNDNFTELMEKLNLDISEDSKLTIAIQLLSYMIPPKQRVKQKNSGKTKHYNKASIISSRDSMIKCATTCGDITRIRQESSDKAKEMRTSVQPYIIVVGQIENISQSYVSIDEILYSTKSTLEALDICFKAFHVLQINYPDASKHLWYGC